MRFTPGFSIIFALALMPAGGAVFAADRCGNADMALPARIYVAPAGGNATTTLTTGDLEDTWRRNGGIFGKRLHLAAVGGYTFAR
jgi:hypothetical protein